MRSNNSNTSCKFLCGFKNYVPNVVPEEEIVSSLVLYNSYNLKLLLKKRTFLLTPISFCIQSEKHLSIIKYLVYQARTFKTSHLTSFLKICIPTMRI